MSFTYQYNNFGSYALARGLVEQTKLQKISAYESSFVLQNPTNDNICTIHNALYSLVRPFCPYNIEGETCPELSEIKTGSCGIFLSTNMDKKYSQGFRNYLKSVHGVATYFKSTEKFFKDKITQFDTYSEPNSKDTEPSAASLLSLTVNNKKVLVYQTQNNLMSNSISTLAFVDYLKWDHFNEFLAAKTVQKSSSYRKRVKTGTLTFLGS